MARRNLYRSCKSRVLGGVCGGLGEYFDVDPVLIRLLFLISIIAGGIGFVVYLFAWLVIPNDPKCEHENVKDEIKEAAQDVADAVKTGVRNKKDDNRAIIGIIILIFGLLLLVKNITGLHFWNYFWPIILIVLGLFVLFKDVRKGDK